MNLKFICLTIIFYGCQIRVSSETKGYVDSKRIWDTFNIPVCWVGANGYPENELKWIQDSISESWERWSQLEFTGWSACNSGFRDGVIVGFTHDIPHAKFLGKKPNERKVKIELNLYSRCRSTAIGFSRETCLKYIAIHEFGHILGFAHEQNRSDTPEDCKDKEQGSNGDVMIGEWDKNSVMNYCNPQNFKTTKLSQSDIEMLQEYYGSPNQVMTRATITPTKEWQEISLLVEDNSEKITENFSVNINMKYRYLEDLEINLQSPQGTVVQLHNQTRNHYRNITGSYPTTLKIFEPTSFQKFIGENIEGKWKLLIKTDFEITDPRVDKSLHLSWIGFRNK